MEQNEPGGTAEPRSDRTANIIAWVIAVPLAAVLLTTAVMKLGGYTTEIFPGAAMTQHPVWFRSVVGVAEGICAVLLLVPITSSFAALAIAMMMVGAMVTLMALHAPGVMYPGVLFVMALVVAWLRRPLDINEWFDDELHRPHLLLREAVISGFLGATAIAIWFLIVDTFMGRPFFTPALLGRSLLSMLGPTPVADSPFVYVLGYTVVHYVSFFLVGLVAVSIIQWAQSQPAVLAGALILFVAFEIIFHGLVAILQETTNLGSLSWVQIMLGNLIAAAVMGVYLWKQHPELKLELDQALSGTDEYPVPVPEGEPVHDRPSAAIGTPAP